MDSESLWKAVLGELEVTLSKANYTTWFKNTSLAVNDGGRVVISVPNVFTKEWLENKYRSQISDAFRNILGKVESVEFIVGKITVEPEKEDEPAPDAPEPKISSETQLNPKYDFTGFIIGSSNRLAHAAAKAVTNKPGAEYNPLFIYGGSGLGKTHLIQAVGNEILVKFPDKAVLYVTAERFMSEFIDGLRTNRITSFKNKYRKVDVLLMDDIQILAGKDQTQEEFFHCFNALHQAQKQIVLTSDRPPKAIPLLEERLRSRFEWGMLADIQPPDLETRIAIFQQKAKHKGYDIELDIIDYIARNIQNNVRELEGALNRIVAYCELNGSEPTINIVTQILGSTASMARRKAVSAKTVIEKIASFYDLTKEDLTGAKRSREIVVPRQITMYLLREELKLSFPKIGLELGGKDHTTVMHACGKIEKAIDSDEPLRHEIALIKERLYVG